MRSPGLAVRVSASGRKSFTLYYRHQGRMRRLGLGRYPDVLLEKARKIATQHRGRIYDGADPAGDKQAEQAHNEQTVQALYDLYRSHQEKTLRSWSEVRRIMEREVLPVEHRSRLRLDPLAQPAPAGVHLCHDCGGQSQTLPGFIRSRRFASSCASCSAWSGSASSIFL